MINALKHAFPHGGSGKIVVSYLVSGSDWTPDGHRRRRRACHPTGRRAKAGLGTSIVEALTAQLGGDLAISSTSGGTTVAIAKKTPAEIRVAALRAV